jgi:nickel/cobalt exporter
MGPCWSRSVLGCILLLGTQHPAIRSAAIAHPIPSRSYDRTVVVRVSAAAVIVDYQLELDDFTVLFDVTAASGPEEASNLRGAGTVRTAFGRRYGPILADRLAAELDGRPLTFTCAEQRNTMVDWDGKPLDHPRFAFRFQAPWQSAVGPTHRFTFRDGTYENEAGPLRLSLAADRTVSLEKVQQPDPVLLAKATTELGPGDEERLRQVVATFTEVEGAEPEPETASLEPAREQSPSDLMGRLLDSRTGYWMALYLAACLGAVHALQPGHGKALVAAYLVGERGTAWHAVYLGLVVTATHTGAVLVVAAVTRWVFGQATPDKSIQTVLGLVSGLSVAGIGLWLLFRRLAGQPDHFHLGGGHHHHPHGHGPGHVHTNKAREGWGRLTLLGVTGGLVPCVEAWLVYLYLVGARPLLALPALLAFSGGLAAVLVVVGLLVVQSKGFAGGRWGESRLFQALPLASAAVITVLGLWLSYDSLH